MGKPRGRKWAGAHESKWGQRTSFNGADGISNMEHVAIEGMERLGESDIRQSRGGSGE
jgi:hypothetical protein